MDGSLQSKLSSFSKISGYVWTGPKNRYILCYVGKLTEERDLWSSAAYTLSLKVTDKHSLNTAKKLHLCEKAWAKLSRHFAIFLSEKDSIQVSVSEALTLTGDARYTKSISTLLSRSIVWSLLCDCVSARTHCCVICDVTRDLLFTWYIVNQPALAIEWTKKEWEIVTYFEVIEKDLIALLPNQRAKGLVYSCRELVRRAKKLCAQITAEITLRRLRLSLGQARLQKVKQCKCKHQAC